MFKLTKQTIMRTGRMSSLLTKDNMKAALMAFIAYRAYRAWSPAEVKSIEGKVCVVTGAGGGLGLALIKELRNRKCGKLILWDIKEEFVRKAAEVAGGDCETRVVDLSKRANIYEAIDQTSVLPHYVFNVAGIVSGNYVCDNSDEIDELTFQVNTLAHLWIFKKYLPMFEKRGEGHFVNVSSAAALYGAAGMVSYAGSKGGAFLLSQALTNELTHRGSPVRCTCVCPSHFHTALFEGFKFLGNLAMTPEYVAQKAVQSALAERELVVLPLYLLSTLPITALWQMNGFINFPTMDRSNPMANWGGKKHAQEVFKAMGASL